MSTILTRRTFLRHGSAAAAAVWIAGPLARGSANGKLNVAFVGVANRAADDLAEVAKESQSVVVAALCDVDDNLLAQAKTKHATAETYTDFRQMVERKDLDALVVATPDHCHAVAAMAGLKRGLHVYCEKPLTHTVAEARAITDAARKFKRVTQLGTQIHAGTNYRRVVELVQSGAIGPIKEVHVWNSSRYGGMERPKDTPPVPPGFHWDLWLGPVEYRPYHPDYAPFKWRNWWAFGGGSLADFGCHFMDLPFWALELRYPTSVEVVDGPPVNPESTPPWLIVRYRFPERKKSGTSLPPVTLQWYHGDKQPTLLSEEQANYFKSGVFFVGEKGNLLADYTRRQLLPEKDFADFKAPAPFIPNSVGHHKEWVEACKSGGTTTCNFDYSGPLTETALLGNACYRTGKKFEWDAEHLQAKWCPEADQFIQYHYRDGWAL